MDTINDTAMPKAKETALKYADQVAAALHMKFKGDYTPYVRHIETSDFNFVEIELRRKGTTDGPTVAYSQEYFEEMVDPTVKQARAKRILKDLEIHLGIYKGPEDAPSDN
jgi:hypothetical protein